MNMKEKANDFKLKIDLVPSTSWYNNLRKAVSKSKWDKIRKKAYSDYGYKCGICDAEGRLSCHEIWIYDDENHIQKLEGFIALCTMCHHVKHIGFAGILAQQGKLDYGKVIAHFMSVNKCDYEDFEEHREKAFEIWKTRSENEWNVELGEYENDVKRGE